MPPTHPINTYRGETDTVSPLARAAQRFPPMIVTIDGPAGAGKSSAARTLAQRLGFEFLDTGATYRAVALAALRGGLDLHDQDGLARLVDILVLEMPNSGINWLEPRDLFVGQLKE